MANFLDILRQTLGTPVQHQVAAVPLPGGGIVPTREDIARSEAAAQTLGIPVNTPAPPESITPDMVVSGQVGQPAPVDASRYLLDSGAPSLSNVDWAVRAQMAREENDRQVHHKGMFGLHGTLRDVLGTLGDAFLVQGGGKAVYAPTREREREGDAMAGMTQAPRAAVERMTAVNPELARSMGHDVVTAEAAQAALERQAQQEAAARYEKGVRLFGGMLGATTAETYDRMRPILQRLKQTYGLGDEYKIPDQFDPDYAAAVSNGAINPYQQQTLDQGDRRIDQGERRTEASIRQGDERIEISRGQLAVARQNAETARKRMEKSGSSGSRPRADTELEYFRSLEKIPATQRTGDENAWVRKFTGQNTRGSGRRSLTPPSVAPSSGRFRLRN